MKRRCYNVKCTRYKDYGGRGIKIYHEWLQYISFKRWALANGYKNNLQIDRKNNDGDYTPGNCQFVTQTVNSRNTRRTKLNTLTVKLIRALRDEGYKPRELLKIFDINLGNLENIIYDRSWIIDI